MLEEILSQYGLSAHSVEPFGTGLINRTWLVKSNGDNFILQKINTDVFTRPEYISENIELVNAYLRTKHPDYFFVAPVRNKEGRTMTGNAEKGFYRVFPFVKNSRTHDVVRNPDQAFEASKQFGLFSQLLSGLPLQSLKTTLPGFHDLSMRYRQFEQACMDGNPARIRQVRTESDFLRQHVGIVSTFEKIRSSGRFKTRVAHHDTKISNVLFDQHDKGICVIDLDTIMPGYFISDVGDMFRTYLSPVSEEEQNFSKIEIRDDYFKAIVDGYLSKMAGELNHEELQHIVYAGVFMIYMQAIRFLADYMNDDRYYGAAYEEHNYNRAKNQITLLKRLQEKEKTFDDFIAESFFVRSTKL
ncbi:MAG TPA: aminoglycoside phosphotransferase family protein [Flavisolibacter sp.]|nr:aminoglycoside phosphotransferase family protein [Flavisolibacter sp.]